MTQVVNSPVVETKKAWQSKTMIMGMVSALLPVLCPPAAVWIAANPEAYSALLGLIFGGLRLISSEKVVIK
jgi:hypothetical protein